MRLLSEGKIKCLSAGSLKISPMVREALENLKETLRDKLILRNAEVCNGLETVSRMGLVALNACLEVDVFGNANSSHVLGSEVVNGLGGGANFAQASLLSVIVAPSTAKGGRISTVVPMVSHHDIIEHDVDVLVTENGVADLRGLDEMERANLIIEKCAHESYREGLRRYLAKAGGGHHPVNLEEAFSWHLALAKKGSMLEAL